MVKLKTFMARFKPKPDIWLDVVIVEIDGSILACAMTERVYYRLAREWAQAVKLKAWETQAGYYWMEVNGQPTNHGLLLTNIVSLTGVIPTAEIESAT